MSGPEPPVTQHVSGAVRVSTGSKWEPVMGYSRAVRKGNWIAASGTVGINPDGQYPPTIEALTARSLVEVRRLIDEEALIEIEVDAIVD